MPPSKAVRDKRRPGPRALDPFPKCSQLQVPLREPGPGDQSPGPSLRTRRPKKREPAHRGAGSRIFAAGFRADRYGPHPAPASVTDYLGDAGVGGEKGCVPSKDRLGDTGTGKQTGKLGRTSGGDASAWATPSQVSKPRPRPPLPRRLLDQRTRTHANAGPGYGQRRSGSIQSWNEIAAVQDASVRTKGCRRTGCRSLRRTHPSPPCVSRGKGCFGVFPRRYRLEKQGHAPSLSEPAHPSRWSRRNGLDRQSSRAWTLPDSLAGTAFRTRRPRVACRPPQAGHTLLTISTTLLGFVSWLAPLALSCVGMASVAQRSPRPD